MTGSFLKRWGIFIWERFSPINYALLIFSFLMGNGLLAIRITHITMPPVFQVVLIVIVVFFVFFHLRLFDELKDYETDLKVHPERPLARGIIKINEIEKTAKVVILFEILLSALINLQALLSILFVVGFSLIMLKEFFVGEWLRPQMELYAITHTFVSVFMSLFVFSAFTSLFLWQIPLSGMIFAFDAWLIFTVFEFARKTYAEEEELFHIDSYSKRLGRTGAVFAVILMVIFSLLGVLWIGEMVSISFLYFYVLLSALIIMVISGIIYILVPKIVFARIYRQTVNLYMLLFYFMLGMVLL